jgi:hypothetical protein
LLRNFVDGEEVSVVSPSLICFRSGTSLKALLGAGEACSSGTGEKGLGLCVGLLRGVMGSPPIWSNDKLSRAPGDSNNREDCREMALIASVEVPRALRGGDGWADAVCSEVSAGASRSARSL